MRVGALSRRHLKSAASILSSSRASFSPTRPASAFSASPGNGTRGGAALKVGYSPELKGIGFFNFAPIELPPPPEAPKAANTDGYPPYPSLPAWPSQ